MEPLVLALGGKDFDVKKPILLPWIIFKILFFSPNLSFIVTF